MGRGKYACNKFILVSGILITRVIYIRQVDLHSLQYCFSRSPLQSLIDAELWHVAVRVGFFSNRKLFETRLICH